MFKADVIIIIIPSATKIVLCALSANNLFSLCQSISTLDICIREPFKVININIKIYVYENRSFSKKISGIIFDYGCDWQLFWLRNPFESDVFSGGPHLLKHLLVKIIFHLMRNVNCIIIINETKTIVVYRKVSLNLSI